MEEFFNHSHHPEGDIVHGQLFIASSEPPTFLEPAHHALDDVPLAVADLIERCVLWLVLTAGDHSLDVVVFEPLPDMFVTVTFVSGQLLGPEALPTMMGQQDTVHESLEDSRLMLLAWRHIDAQRNAMLLAKQMNFGAEATSRVAQRMVRRLLQLGRFWAVQQRRCVLIFFSPHPLLVCLGCWKHPHTTGGGRGGHGVRGGRANG